MFRAGPPYPGERRRRLISRAVLCYSAPPTPARPGILAGQSHGRSMSALPSTLVPVLTLAVLALLFALKHLVADFIFQTSWIAHGKEGTSGWVLPLAAHAGIHAAMTLAITLAVRPSLWWLAILDLAVHFLIDRGKSITGRWGGWTATDARYWWLLGFDQFLHQATNIGLATALVVP